MTESISTYLDICKVSILCRFQQLRLDISDTLDGLLLEYLDGDGRGHVNGFVPQMVHDGGVRPIVEEKATHAH